MKLFTLGYQNLSSDLYSQALVNAGAGLVIDVREHAWSQRPDFVKRNLKETLRTFGIDYLHFKPAGNPSANRKSARSAAECLNRYRQHLAKNRDCLSDLIEILRTVGRTACLTCYERNPQDCHRSVLVDELLQIDPTLRVIHLEPSLKTKTPKTLRRSTTVVATAFLAPQFLPFQLNKRLS